MPMLLIVAVLGLAGLAESSAPFAAQSVAAQAQTTQTLLAEGRVLPPSRAAELEAQLLTDADNFETRTRLLGYYSLATLRDPATRVPRRKHVLWVVEQHPRSELAIMPETEIEYSGDPEGYDAARKAWLDQVDRQHRDPQILWRAAKFVRIPDKASALTLLKESIAGGSFGDYPRASGTLGETYALTILGITRMEARRPLAADPEQAVSQLAKTAVAELRQSANSSVLQYAGLTLSQHGPIVQTLTGGAVRTDALAEEFLKRAVEIKPPSMLAPQYLARFYKSRMIAATNDEQRQGLARRWLDAAAVFVERATAVTVENRATRWALPVSMLDAANAALSVRAIDRAKGYAQQLLDLSDAPGLAQHDAHVVLGRAALDEGDVPRAKTELSLAGHVLAGQIASPGPSMALAKELLDRGERAAVLAYFETCRRSWKDPRLDQWIQVVKAGGAPDFGPNLGAVPAAQPSQATSATVRQSGPLPPSSGSANAAGQFWTPGEISPEANALIEAGDAVGLRALLGRKPELVKATNHVRWTLLHFMTASYVVKNQVGLCLTLIEAGADVNAQEGEFNAPLHFAVARPPDGQNRSSSEVYLDVIRLLLDKGANVRAKNYLGLSPLHVAVMRRAETGAVELLIERGAAVNAVADRDGWTPLHGAAGMGRADLVQVLLKRGADRAAKDGRGLTPLQVAEAARRPDIVKLLQGGG